MRSTKEAHQVRQRIGFIHGGVELELVRQVYGLHTVCIANAKKKETPPQNVQTQERPFMDLERPLRLQAYGLQRLPTSGRSPADCHGRLALLGAFTRPRRPHNHAGSAVLAEKRPRTSGFYLLADQRGPVVNFPKAGIPRKLPIETLADVGSVLGLRPHFGRTMITALTRIEGRAIGLVANNPMHLAGAIDSDGADKAARFIVLCDAFDIPLLYLCDTPGIIVGPEIEKTALVRHSSRMFVAGANVQVLFLKIILRKAYGLGAIAMSGGADDAAIFTVSWPTGEFGPMALEGAAKLGYRNELAALVDPVERKQRFDDMVAGLYQRGKALNVATHFAIDDVIDPADSRRWLTSALRSTPVATRRTVKKYPFIDSW
jgi:hypothetical protein